MRPRGLVLILVAACTRLAGAQRVHGVVRDALGGQPISGAVVSALGAGGASLSRDLTNAAGAYSLDLPAGAARLRVVRIGFHPADAAVSATSAADVTQDFTLQPLPSLLQKVSVSEAEQCPKRDDRDRALGLWEQARAGLLASVAARDARPGDMWLLDYRRLFTNDRIRLLWQQVQADSARTSRPFVPIAPAADFAARGYMLAGIGGVELGAPDADVLLDDSFAATHCFSIAAPDVLHPGDLGLAFEPAPGRTRLVDVRGVLWIDRSHPAIRALDFRYTGLSPNDIEVGAGGTISFRSMPNGVVFIDAWNIVSAEVAERDMGGWMPRAGTVRTRVRVSGGQVTRARWDDGMHWEVPTASARGRVVAGRVPSHGHVEAIPGVDTAGVRVWLPGTTDTTTTDSTGGFRFDGLLPGRYAVEAATPVLAQAGVAQNIATDSVTAMLDNADSAIVHLDSAVFAARAICGDPSRPMAGTVLFVRVVDPDNWNVPGDSVFATWTKPPTRILGLTFSREGRFEGRTDHDGRVAVCDPPRGEPVSLIVGHESRPQVSTTVTLPVENPIAMVTVRLPRPSSN